MNKVADRTVLQPPFDVYISSLNMLYKQKLIFKRLYTCCTVGFCYEDLLILRLMCYKDHLLLVQIMVFISGTLLFLFLLKPSVKVNLGPEEVLW